MTSDEHEQLAYLLERAREAIERARELRARAAALCEFCDEVRETAAGTVQDAGKARSELLRLAHHA